MVCKYCGDTVKSSGSTSLWGQKWGPNCPASPNKKHVLTTGDTMECKYCGDVVKSSGGSVSGLWGQRRGPQCNDSETGKHELS
jgi:hypothetical protein